MQGVQRSTHKMYGLAGEEEDAVNGGAGAEATDTGGDGGDVGSSGDIEADECDTSAGDAIAAAEAQGSAVAHDGDAATSSDATAAATLLQGTQGFLKPAELQYIFDAKRMAELVEGLQEVYDDLTKEQQGEWTANPRVWMSIFQGLTDKQNISTARFFFGFPELIRACKAAGETQAAVIFTAFMDGQKAWDMPSLHTDERTILLAGRSYAAWRILGPYLAMPMPQTVRGMSTKVLLRMISNADARLWTLNQLPSNLRHNLVERAITSDPCELLFSLVVQLCGYKPPPQRLLPALATITFAAELKAEPENLRGFPIPEAKENAWYDVSALEAGTGLWNCDDLNHAMEAKEKVYLNKHAKRSAVVANATKHKPLRELGGFKRR